MADKPTVTVDVERLASVLGKISHVKHEINNPLMGILGHAELMMNDPEASDKLRAKAQIILGEARRISNEVKTLEDLKKEFAALLPADPDAIG